ncbi:MAG TPA: DnaA regulatory inactivator Hda [Woeseiaceae bacterium]|nr:DnaA regulatory inactivator Hda [Woeseiaceae bacterium]
MSQLALPIGLADHAVFTSFVAAGNEELWQLLQSIAEAKSGTGCWIWGAAATGKTHLLQAVCERAGDRAAFVPLGALADAGAGMLQGLESRELVCLDDLQLIAGRADWEHALFTLYNELQQHAGQLVVAASMPPRECPIELPDLLSRLTQLPSYNVRPLADAERIAALVLRAKQRGLYLPDEAARYLLTHSRRDMGSLYDLLDRLDKEAMRAQRRLTVPFVSEMLRKMTTDQGLT